MFLLDWIAAIGGGLILWTVACAPVAFVLGRVARFRNAQIPPPPPDDPDATADDPDEDVVRIDVLPEESPLGLVGYELDAAFYAVVAPSFSGYR